MQRAMELKKKRNLEPFKGNPSASLQPDKLNQIYTYVNLKIGVNSEEATFIINNLVANEQMLMMNLLRITLRLCYPLH
jgi:hypothetical protein